MKNIKTEIETFFMFNILFKLFNFIADFVKIKL